MKSFLLFSILIIIFGLISILAETKKEGVVYCVSPTEQLSSCPRNNSGQLCHTVDYLASHSSEFFSPDHVSITLVFMCGVHNYTKSLTIENRHSFVMKGAAESRENVIIDHQFGAQSGNPNCTVIQFFNVSFVNITSLTMKCPAINLKESHVTVKSSDVYGYPGIIESLSYLYIFGSGSQALLDNCTFKENCMVTGNYSDGIVVSNSTFQSYRHQINSIIVAYSSAVTLTGNVNFSDSITGINQPLHSSGTAVFLRTTHPELKSSLNITTGSTVYFTNLSCSNYGGAVYAENATIHISIRARVVFMHNTATYGGAISLRYHATIILISGNESNVDSANKSSYGGAISNSLSSRVLSTNYDSHLRFSHSSARGSGRAEQLYKREYIGNDAHMRLNFSNKLQGGAAYSDNSMPVNVNTSDIVCFYNNTANRHGGAMYFFYGFMHINSNRSVNFTMNMAQTKGGALYIEAGVHSSIIVGASANLLLSKNSAFQGGALYVATSSFAITVSSLSRIQFVNNTASDVGGGVYTETQSEAPCLFLITDYSAAITFIGNHANHSIGHHMYGTSVRGDRCDQQHIMNSLNKQGKPYCWHYAHEKSLGHINISFTPETLSPVSSAPHRVCLCDSNGPQCANISYISTNISVYRGESFTLSACVVGYNFGTTTGVVYARFHNSTRSS